MTRRGTAVGTILLLAGLAAAPVTALPPGGASPPAEAAESRFATLFATASLWRVGDDVDRVEAARRELAAAGEPAVRWLLRRRLGVATTLERRALDAVLVARREIAGPAVLARIREDRDRDPATRENLARLARKLGLREAAPVLAGWLRERPAPPAPAARSLSREVLSALAALDPGRAVAVGRELLEAPDPWIRVAALRALGRSGDPGVGDDLAAAAIGPGTAIVRGAAALALADLGPPSVPPLERTLAHCAREDADPAACGFPVRAAAALLRQMPGGEADRLRAALDRVAALGPEPLAGLVVELEYGTEPVPGR